MIDSHSAMRPTLILGGTTEGNRLAAALAAEGLPAIHSLAGRTEAPRAQPVPVRVGGFGGVAGLVRYLKDAGVGRVIDATHPFAAQMSRNAVSACAAAGVSLLALERPPWVAGPGDDWLTVPDLDAAVAALPGAPARIFLAIGRQHLAAFAARPGHHYLVRVIDPPAAPLPLPRCTVEVARGPFDVAGDRALMTRHRIALVVARNAGGSGAVAKLHAARALGLKVVMIARPALPARRVVASVKEALAWLHADLGV